MRFSILSSCTTILFVIVILETTYYTYARPKPFYWGQYALHTTKAPLLKRMVSKVNHWFKDLINAYPPSTWSWREHIYGQTYWKDPAVVNAWYYKADEENEEPSPKTWIWHPTDRVLYWTPKPGCDDNPSKLEEISSFKGSEQKYYGH